MDKKQEHLGKGKTIAVLSGGDWSDASVRHRVALVDFDINEAQDSYRKWYRDVYCPKYRDGEKPEFYTFSNWLVKEGLAREATEDDVLEYFEV